MTWSPLVAFQTQSRKDRGGFVMVLVMITIMATAAMAAVHQRSLTAAIRLEQARMESERVNLAPRAALAVAVEALHTGDPFDGDGTAEYRLDHTFNGVTTMHRVTYFRVGTTWSVTADPDPSAGSLAMLPANL